MTFRVAAVLADSRANGPGTRYTLWLQGCERRCDGCANAEFQSRLGGKLRAVAAVAEEILAAPRIDGVTISGGEPFDQADAVFELIRRVRRRNDRLTFFVFSGYTFAELDSRYAIGRRPDQPDALLCGPFRRENAPDYERFLPSANQELISLTDRLNADDFRDLPLHEEIIRADGTVLRSGILRQAR
ncbi:hypothetical protein BEQ56_12680 [Anaerolineaceae bacterium oral taxon 439]|nr:hypothetical protein BEQ56_12680 [Anaerolineaceae bacterium oral taxon 439]